MAIDGCEAHCAAAGAYLALLGGATGWSDVTEGTATEILVTTGAGASLVVLAGCHGECRNGNTPAGRCIAMMVLGGAGSLWPGDGVNCLRSLSLCVIVLI